MGPTFCYSNYYNYLLKKHQAKICTNDDSINIERPNAKIIIGTEEIGIYSKLDQNSHIRITDGKSEYNGIRADHEIYFNGSKMISCSVLININNPQLKDLLANICQS